MSEAAENWMSQGSTRKWAVLRLATLERDGYKCQRCGSHDFEKLQSHHIKPKKKYPELRFEIDNLLTLCLSCHMYIHRTHDPNFLTP